MRAQRAGGTDLPAGGLPIGGRNNSGTRLLCRVAGQDVIGLLVQAVQDKAAVQKEHCAETLVIAQILMKGCLNIGQLKIVQTEAVIDKAGNDIVTINTQVLFKIRTIFTEHGSPFLLLFYQEACSGSRQDQRGVWAGVRSSSAATGLSISCWTSTAVRVG